MNKTFVLVSEDENSDKLIQQLSQCVAAYHLFYFGEPHRVNTLNTLEGSKQIILIFKKSTHFEVQTSVGQTASDAIATIFQKELKKIWSIAASVTESKCKLLLETRALAVKMLYDEREGLIQFFESCLKIVERL